MQVWHCAAVRRSFHGEIPQRNSSGGEIGSSAQRVCTKLRGGRKSTKSQRINNNEVLSDSEGEENGSESKLLAHRACPSHGHEGPAMAVCGWRPWDQILRWRLPAWTHGTEEPLTMTLDVGRGGLSWEARDGQAHVYGLTKVQRLDNRPQTCSSIQNQGLAPDRVVDNRETTWDLSWACEVQWLRQVEKRSHCTVTNAFLSFGQINQLCNILLTIVQLQMTGVYFSLHKNW